MLALRFGMDAEPLIGRTLIGRFRIDRVLGRGGMATVYAAFDQERDVAVALKVLKRELSSDPLILRRFEREAKAASQLSHPNVVQVIDWGVDEDQAFIAMELAQGLDLLTALAQERPMRQTRAVILLGQVCAALSAAHAKGIVHRDLKPENVLIVPDPAEPGGERAKVLDFGIVKLVELSETAKATERPSFVTNTALTRAGTIVGTPAYMSPEQCRGDAVDARSDIYACGVLLYQLVTGDLPFNGETPLHTAMLHIQTQPQAPSELRRNLDPTLESVILKALAKWPSERQQSAAALREELHRTVPRLPDRGTVAIVPGPAPGHASKRPPPPQLLSAGRHPNALQLATEGSTGGRLAALEPGAAVPTAHGPSAPPAPLRQESRLIDSEPATRQKIGASPETGARAAPSTENSELRTQPAGGRVATATDPRTMPIWIDPTHPERLHSTTDLIVEQRTEEQFSLEEARTQASTETGLTPTAQTQSPSASNRALRGTQLGLAPPQQAAVPQSLAPLRDLHWRSSPGTNAGSFDETEHAAPDASDDDEARTNVRAPTALDRRSVGELASNTTNLGRTLVMGEQALPAGRDLGLLAVSGIARFGALKATARLPEEDAVPTAASPRGQLGLDEADIKATARLNRHEAIAGAIALQQGEGYDRPVGIGASSPANPTFAVFGQLQPGQWNEPTVVRRNPRRAPSGWISQLAGLSGTTGLLIGVGLGLGLAAALLITFLLLR